MTFQLTNALFVRTPSRAYGALLETINTGLGALLMIEPKLAKSECFIPEEGNVLSTMPMYLLASNK